MSEAPGFETSSPAGLPDGKMEDNAPVNVDAILQSILSRGAERFDMAAAVLRGERIIAQGAAGVRKRGTAERITLRYWYPNEGYILAGAVLEHLTGRAWEDLMRERLFQPLGISTGGRARSKTTHEPGKDRLPPAICPNSSYARLFASDTCAMRSTASQRASTGDAPRLETPPSSGNPSRPSPRFQRTSRPRVEPSTVSRLR